jgi:predicted nucleic acid-binding protein
MAINIIDIRTYQPKSTDVFFFDNNIWMFLFCPIGNYEPYKQKQYSTFFKYIQTAKATVFVNSLVLSEFANTYFRLDFKLWKNTEKHYDGNYKQDYIPTKRYTKAAHDVKAALKDILQCSDRNTDNFNAVELNNIYSHMDYIDFNDSYYLELARIGQWKIVTDDHDFKKITHAIPIVTIP